MKLEQLKVGLDEMNDELKLLMDKAGLGHVGVLLSKKELEKKMQE